MIVPGNRSVRAWVTERSMRSSLLLSSLLLSSLLLSVACDKTPTRDDRPPATAPAASSAAPLARAPDAAPRVEKVEIPEVRVRAGSATTVRVSWIVPPGTAVNDDAPFRVRWNRSDGLTDAPADVKSTGSAVKNGFSVSVQPMPGAPNATLDGEIDIVVCDDTTHSVCVPVRRSVGLGFVITKDAAAEATVSIPLPAAK